MKSTKLSDDCFEPKLRVDFAALSMSSGAMKTLEKVCPIAVRFAKERPEVLAFTHPSAGKQFVKGTIEPGEAPLDAATRELREESGLRADTPLISLGTHCVGGNRQRWHFSSTFRQGFQNLGRIIQKMISGIHSCFSGTP